MIFGSQEVYGGYDAEHWNKLSDVRHGGASVVGGIDPPTNATKSSMGVAIMRRL